MDSGLHTLFPKRFLQGRRLGYLAIADTLTQAILSSGLRGRQLPAQRAVAKHLGVAIATVSHAYSELERRGLTRSRPGVGTYVCNFQNSEPIKNDADVHEAVIDLTVSRPPVEGATRCFAHALAAISSKRNLCDLLGFEPANGWQHHRAAVAAWVSGRGYPIKANQVIACNGVQHALSVIFGALAKPGDIIVTEELNYPGIKLLADTYRIRLLGIPMDGEGMQTDALEQICRREKVAFVLCSPTAHNPTTITLSAERRQRMAGLANVHNFLIIENDILGMMPVNKQPSIFSLEPRKTIYVTGVTKTLATGLRLGFIIASTALLHPLMGGVRSTTWMPPPLMLEILTWWIEEEMIDEIINWHRREIMARLKIAKAVLGSERLCCDPGTYHVWMRLPPDWHSSDFVERSYECGVSLSPSDTFTVNAGQEAPDAARISLGFPNDRERLRAGLEKIAMLFAHDAS